MEDGGLGGERWVWRGEVEGERWEGKGGVLAEGCWEVEKEEREGESLVWQRMGRRHSSCPLI